MIVPHERGVDGDLPFAQGHEEPGGEQVGGRAGVAGVVVGAEPGVEIEEGGAALWRVEAGYVERAPFDGRSLRAAALADDMAVARDAQGLQLRLDDGPLKILETTSLLHQLRQDLV